MLNVDAGNSPVRPDNPRELRAAWKVTLLAIAGIALFVLLFIAVTKMRQVSPSLQGGEEQGQGQVTPGEPTRRTPGGQ